MNHTMTLEVKKTRLKSQIKLLERLKNDTKNNLDNFAEINENDINNYSFITTNSQNETSSLLKIKNELLKLAGLRCIKSVKDDYVFQFTVKGEDKQINYFVQLLKTNNGLLLGKWNFPMFLDVNDIWNETKVVDVNTLSQFLRKCKHSIDCYHHRMNQFIKFQNSMKQCANCIINRDQAYRYFLIELLQVYNVKRDNYINIIVYLQYNLEEIRPFRIKVESQHDGPLSQETEKDMKPFFKPFKQFDLTDALETVESKENHLFSWQRVSRDTTLIDNMDLDDISPRRKQSSNKYRTFKTKQRSVSSAPKINDQSKGNQVDISTYFKKSESAAATKRKKPENSSKEQSEQESSTKISRPLKKNLPKLKHLESNKNIHTKKAKTMPKKVKPKDHTLTENNDNDISQERRILRSLSKSPTKDARSKRNSPQKMGSFSKLSTNSSKNDVSPKKKSPQKAGLISKSSFKKDASVKKNATKKVLPIKKSITSKAIHSKKLENLKKLVSPRIIVSSATSNVKLKQTNLQIPKIDKNNQKKSLINLNNSDYVLRTKIVTSTPHLERTKRLRQSLADMNLSEIKNTKKTRVSKSPTKRTVKKSNKVKK